LFGMPPDEGLYAADDLLRLFAASPALHCALGVWTAAGLPVDEEWSARLPGAAHGVLDRDPARSRAALDAWVEKETDGLLHALPVSIEPDTLLVLASALTVRTRWERPFTAAPTTPQAGPWKGRRIAGLSRKAPIADVRIAAGPDGPVTLVTVQGTDEIDVLLALGEPDARPAGVLAAAVGACGACGADADAVAPTAPVDLDQAVPGPGLTVGEIRAVGPEPAVSLRTVAFTVAGHHRLLEQAEVFGLRTACDPRTGRFPGISSAPLRVEAAAQDATATFSARGFVAAAVSAVAMPTAMVMPQYTAKHLTAVFDRPFAFAAAHRPSGLVLVCGWVDDPDTFPGGSSATS
jgi:hypothetical protein